MQSTVPRHSSPPRPPASAQPHAEQAAGAPTGSPVVYVAPVWEYRTLTRPVGPQALATDAELNALSAEGWELAAVIAEPTQVRLYFRRQRD